MKLIWTIISLFIPFSRIFFITDSCSFDYVLIASIAFAMIGYFLFRNQTATLISKKGLLGIIIIGSFGLIRLKVYDYQSCIWSIDVTLNVISTLILLVVLIIGFGINNLRNHERIKSNAFERNENEE